MQNMGTYMAIVLQTLILPLVAQYTILTSPAIVNDELFRQYIEAAT